MRVGLGMLLVGLGLSWSPANASAQAGSAPVSLAPLERSYDSLRYLRDQLDVTRSRGADTTIHGVTTADLATAYRSTRRIVEAQLTNIPRNKLTPPELVAFATMEKALQGSLGPDLGRSSVAPTRGPTCQYDPVAVATTPWGRDSLEGLIFGCYSAATQGIVVDRDTLDRLSILSLLGTTADRAKRERLFRGLDRVWSTVNGHDEPGSPYRLLLPLRRQAWRQFGPMVRGSATLGLTATQVEGWLEQALEAWRVALPETMVEPWDFHYANGAMSRHLSTRIPRDSLLPINSRFYQSLGADPTALNIHFDLEPRPGKYPIAFTTFGARGVLRRGQWTRAEPWVFASYRIGGLENLGELLHETGHGIHLAAVRARPALHDWPDSDSFTEGIADLAWFELYEPAWQRAFLGDTVSLRESLRAKYSGVILDMAWALFEFRVHREGARSPNEVWTEITARYLKIRPHPELSWWAMRGQLVESPGYLLNYALGAFLTADLRRAAVEKFGPLTTGNPGWYAKASTALYRHGLEKPARKVVEEFLGRSLSPQPLLEDLARMRQAP